MALMIYILFEEVLTAVNIKMKFFWDAMGCSLVDEYESFREKFEDEKQQSPPKRS
jgi:hypothetical protein